MNRNRQVKPEFKVIAKSLAAALLLNPEEAGEGVFANGAPDDVTLFGCVGSIPSILRETQNVLLFRGRVTARMGGDDEWGWRVS